MRIAAQMAPGGAPALPPEMQAKLKKLQADLKAARHKRDAKSEAQSLNGIGDFYRRVSKYQDCIDAYNRALILAQSAQDAPQQAAALNGAAMCYSDWDQSGKALQIFQQAMNLATKSGDLVGQATALNGIGWVDDNLGEFQQALEFHNKALPLAQHAGDRDLEATVLMDAGVVYFSLGEQQKALDDENQALPVFRAVGDRNGEGRALGAIGVIYFGQGDNQKAQETLNQSLPILREVGDADGEARVLIFIGRVYSGTGDQQKALDSYNQALPILRAVDDHFGAVLTLDMIGGVYSALGDQQKALGYFTQALALAREARDRDAESRALAELGAAYSGQGDQQKALDFENQALPIARQSGDLADQEGALTYIGDAYWKLGEKQQALDSTIQLLQIYRAAGDRAAEVKTLNAVAGIYAALGDQQKALDSYNQALAIARQLGDLTTQDRSLAAVGNLERSLGQLQKALDSYNQELSDARAAADHEGAAIALNNIAAVYGDLGDLQKALDYLNQALPMFHASGSSNLEAQALNNIGNIYSDLGQPLKALEYLNRALPVFRAAGDKDHEALALDNISVVYLSLGRFQKALDDSNQALPIMQSLNDPDGEAHTLIDACVAYFFLGEKQQARDSCRQALPAATAANDPLEEASVLFIFSLGLKTVNPAEAILFGKQAVNFLQQVRGNIQGLDKQLQASFLSSRSAYYHTLADTLITQNRLPEAQQVLDLLKEQEYSDYTRGAAADTLSPLSLTPAEQQAEEEYQKTTVQLVSEGREFEKLSKENPRSADDEAKFQALKARMGEASKGLTDYYAHLFVVFGGNSGGAKQQVEEIKGHVGTLKREIAASPRTVALYTMVTGDHYRVIVITSSAVPVAREYAIPEADLSRKVAAFDQALRDPRSDPRPPAQELYNILIGPVKADLDQADADTLVWSLDGVLRYVPLAALYDGTHYLVEKYNTVTITPASFGLLSQKPDVSKLSVLAMGISRQYEQNLPALPAVVGELDDVVKDPKVQTAHGVLPGTILLNGQFTEKAMEDALNGQYKVVHIASHFVFQPGDDSKSYLLMAGKDDAGPGYHLTVEDFNDNPSMDLSSTELLTLSACQTGVSGEAANGREVDGLGMTAQGKGARAVISSLWSVNDASTGLLMSDFYKRWVSGGGNVSKVEALRQAQLDLLHDKVNGNGGAAGRGFDVVNSSAPVAAGFSHPYYWAPFVLMGNWQ